MTSIHVDRFKVVTATDRYGPTPVRAWCAWTGEAEPLAELGTALPELGSGAQAPAEPEAGGAGDSPTAAAAAASAAAAAAAAEEEAASSGRPRHAYHREWEGATALAVRGALLVSGSSEGTVVERDFSRGGLPEAEDEWGDCGGLLGKFWQSSVG